MGEQSISNRMAKNNKNNSKTLRRLPDVNFDGESSSCEAPCQARSLFSNTIPELTASTKSSLDEGDVAISFGGCGFLGTYQLGAVKMIHEHGKKFLDKTIRFAGCSSGSLAATVLLLCPERAQEATENMYQVADEINNHAFGVMKPGLIISERLRTAMEQIIPQDISKAQNKLFISVTKLMKLENELISTFENRDNLIEVLLTSCHHPLYSNGLFGAKSPVLNGETYIDGGYTQLIPLFTDIPTVTCSAYASDANICPVEKSMFNDDTTCFRFMKHNMKISFSNLRRVKMSLFPPSRAELEKYFQLGAEDAKNFLMDNKVYND